jgi:splicing factor 3B subunit 1
LEFFGDEDSRFFGKLLEVGDSELGLEELKERKIMRLLLKIKNGEPAVRKVRL